jgi:predicted PurR-regulated permease PerM
MASLTCTIAVLVVLIVPMIFVMIAFVKQRVGAAQALQFKLQTENLGRAEVWWDRLEVHFPKLGSDDLATTLQNYGEQAAAYVAIKMGTILKRTATCFFDLFVMTLAMFYLYRDGHIYVERFREVLPFTTKNRNRIVGKGRAVIFASVTSSLVTALAHGFFGTILFLLLGVKAAVFWGVTMGFFSFIPILGSTVVWVPISVSLMVTGPVARGLALLALCAAEVLIVDTVLRPLLINEGSSLSGLVTFIAVIGGIEAFGLLGVILGPIVATMVEILLEVYSPSRNGNGAAPEPVKETSAMLE